MIKLIFTFVNMKTFENTEIAFRSKNDADLNRAFWLFKIIGNPIIVKFGKWMTNFALSVKLPIDPIIKKTIFKQFCGGTTIQDCEQTIQQLSSYKIGTILDYSVEGKIKEEDFERTTDEIIATIERASKDTTIPYAVFKVTGIATFSLLEKANSIDKDLSETEKKSFASIVSRVDRICKSGFDCGIPVFIDAEESWIQDTIDRLAQTMMAKYNKGKAIVFNTIQMYRHDRLDFLVKVIHDSQVNGYHYGIKLVRGAYMEKERARATLMKYTSPIQPNKAATDKDYNKALSLILENFSNLSLCAGTHNEYSSELLTDLLKKFNLQKDDKRIYFAQLLGMSDHISFNLSSEGFNVAKYVPYGPIKEVLPYLLRRADENTSVAGQTSRELSLLAKEKARRKQNK
jgi:proline dehydrogenase